MVEDSGKFTRKTTSGERIRFGIPHARASTFGAVAVVVGLSFATDALVFVMEPMVMPEAPLSSHHSPMPVPSSSSVVPSSWRL